MNERDPELDALWRSHSHEMPAPELDAAIRAAAHRAVHAKPSATLSRARAPWPAWATFAAAAGIGAIAIGVWQLQPKEADVMQGVVSDMPMRAAAPAAREDREAAPKPKLQPGIAIAQSGGMVAPSSRTQAEAAASARPTAPPARSSNAMVAPAPVAPLEPPAQTASSIASGASADKQTLNANSNGTTVDDDALAAKRADDNPRVSAFAPAPTPTPMLAPVPAVKDAAPVANNAEPAAARGAPLVENATPEKRARSASARDVASFVDAIRHALDRQDNALAATVLNAMRARYDDADARLPADLRGWAAGVARAKP